MMGFSASEILNSILYAIGFGLIFSAVYTVLILLSGVVGSIPKVGKEIIIFKKVFPLPDFKSCINFKKVSLPLRLLSVFLFTVGFILISYLSLDGVIRIYMLFFAFATFYLLNFAFFDFLSSIFLISEFEILSKSASISVLVLLTCLSFFFLGFSTFLKFPLHLLCLYLFLT